MASKARGLADLGNAYADGALGSRNRIINGAMVIDQRNAGAAVNTSASAVYYGADRTLFFKNSSANFTIQQSSVAPSGFSKSLSATVTSAATSGAAEEAIFQQNIEGFNTADLGFGTASAQTVTLSFWVRSSLTGTYCVAFRNAAFNRSYVAEYSIAAADTWEFKTITIAGDTSGTWATDNSTGLRVLFDLGSGSNGNATAGAWTASAAIRTTNQANWAGTSGATFYLTGVQLEAGDTATPFEHRSYGQELALCQRYYDAQTVRGPTSCFLPNTAFLTTAFFSQVMRAVPTIVLSYTELRFDGVTTTSATLSANAPTANQTGVLATSIATGGADNNNGYGTYSYEASAEL